MKEFKPTDSPNIFPEIQAGIDTLPDNLFDHDFAYGIGYDSNQLFRDTLSNIFDTDGFSEGVFIGTDPEAQRSVQQGLLNSMQRVATGEALNSGEPIPRGIIHPLREYFKNPDDEIVQAMERRTSRLKKVFMLDDLRECVFRYRHHNGRSYGPLSAELSIDDHPDYKWATVKVLMGFGTHVSTPVRYEFYADAPRQGAKQTRPAASFDVTFIYKEPVPPAYRTDEPYLAGMGIDIDDEEAPNYVRREFDVPEETLELLGGATRYLLTEKMVQIFTQDVDELEGFKGSIAGEVFRAIQTIDDPVELRNTLDGLGVSIEGDPYRFRSEDPDRDLWL